LAQPLPDKYKIEVRKEVVQNLITMTELEQRWQEIPTELAKYKQLEQLIQEYQDSGLFNYTKDLDTFVFFRFGNEHDFLRWAKDVYYKFQEDYVADNIFAAIDGLAREVIYNWQCNSNAAMVLTDEQRLVYTESDVDKVALIMGIYHVLGVKEVQHHELKMN